MNAGWRLNHGIRQSFKRLLLIALFSTATNPALAQDSLLLTGAYAIQKKAHNGGQMRVAMRIQLQNGGSRDLHIQRMTVWDFSHPAKGSTQACSVTVRAGSSSSTTQEFTIPPAEYELWKRGSRPRLVVEIGTRTGRPSSAVVRLDRLSGGKAIRP